MTVHELLLSRSQIVSYFAGKLCLVLSDIQPVSHTQVGYVVTFTSLVIPTDGEVVVKLWLANPSSCEIARSFQSTAYACALSRVAEL
jgi:hypothetical protein